MTGAGRGPGEADEQTLSDASGPVFGHDRDRQFRERAAASVPRDGVGQHPTPGRAETVAVDPRDNAGVTRATPIL